MFKIITIWLVLLHAALFAAQTETKDPFKNIVYMKLDNGMQVYMLADPKAAKVQLEVDVGVGYDNENDETYGLSHLVEHLVFRDARVPHRDYLDYIKEQGGTDVNGFTKRYETGYVATIAPEKAIWLVQTFAQMLFDKHVTQEDLRVEKRALQTEIGEPHWYHRPFYALGHFFQSITPPSDNIYRQDFGLPKEKEIPDRYHAQENNMRFSLDEVMQRYKTYYYPANMKLFVAGKFDPDAMKAQIINTFGNVKKEGNATVVEPHFTPKLNARPYRRFYEGMGSNYAYIGTKYVLDDYTKYLALSVYTRSLAERLQQQLRNKDGKTYTVSDTSFGNDRAQVSSIGFDGLVGVFSDNIKTAEQMVESDRKGMSPEMIKKAIDRYDKAYYRSIEHDTNTLMGLINMQQYLREEHNITNKTSYDIFKSLIPKLIQKTVSEAFVPKHRYKFVYRDYYFFPMETTLLSLLILALFVFVYIRLRKRELKQKGFIFTQRDIVFQRRVSSRFTGFLVIAVTVILAIVLNEWVLYFGFKWLTGDPYYLRSIDVPWSYLFSLIHPLMYMLIFFILYRVLWRYYAKLIVIDDAIVAVGNRVLPIRKETIAQVEVVPFRERRYGRTIGTMLRFYKPLVKLTLKDGSVYFIRSANAEHLREDLEKWLQ